MWPGTSIQAGNRFICLDTGDVVRISVGIAAFVRNLRFSVFAATATSIPELTTDVLFQQMTLNPGVTFWSSLFGSG